MRKMICASVLVLAALMVLPAQARADHGDRGLHKYRYHWGSHVTVLPQRHLSVWVGRAKYYYYDGVYYTGAGVNYVVVPPPIGAVVSSVPAEYAPVVINGVTYYVNDGVYYVNNGYGYQVVPQPVAYPPATAAPAASAAPASTPAAASPMPTTSAPAPEAEEENAQPAAGAPAEAAPNEFTVNIPNSKGGYTPVVLKKTDKGYIGPQGELYPEFPKVEQLKAMYGK